MARTVNAVTRALDILEAFRYDAGPLTPAELSRRVAIPRSSLHEILHTLRQRGYLRLGGTGYVLGTQASALGEAYRITAEIPDLAREAIEQLVAAHNETSQVAVLEGADVLYVAKVDGTQYLRLVSEVGRRLPASCTGVGKVLLAALPEDALHRLYPDHRLPRMTPNSICDWDRFLGELAGVRRRGMALDACESNAAVRCIAAPIREPVGEVVAALSVSVPTARWNSAVQRTLTAAVTDAAAHASQRLAEARA